MNTTVVNSIAVGSLFLFTFISGVLTTRAGRPLKNPHFTIHKLISLAMILFVLVSTMQVYKLQETQALIKLITVMVTILLFLILIITGALLSFEREWPAIVLKLHQIAPTLSLLSTIFTFYLLNISNN